MTLGTSTAISGDLFPYDHLTRQPDVETTPGPTDSRANNYAAAVGESLDMEGSEENIKNEYKHTGKSTEWETHKAVTTEATRQHEQNAIIDRATMQAKEVGIDPNNVASIEDHATVKSLLDYEEALTTGNLNGETDMALFINHSANKAARSLPEEEDRGEALLLSELATPEAVTNRLLSETRLNLETEKHFIEALQLQKDEGLAADSIPNLILDIAAEGLMGFTYANYWEKLHDVVAEQSGKPAGAWMNRLKPGDTIRATQLMILEMSPQERQDASVVLLDAFERMTWLDTDLRKTFAQDYIGGALAGRMPIDEGTQFLENLTYLMYDIGGLLGAAKLARPSTLGGGPAIRTMAKTNKPKYQNLIGSIMTEEGDGLTPMGIKPQDGAQSTMPKPTRVSKTIEDVPEIKGEAARVSDLQTNMGEMVNATRRNLLDDSERSTALTREAGLIEEAHNGQARTALMQTEMHADGNGAMFKIMLGKNSRVGFLSQRTAFEQVEAINASGEGVRVYHSDGADLTPFLTGKEALDELAKIRNKEIPSKRGNYYVQFDRDYFFSPVDRLLFGDEVSLAPKWLGGFSKDLLTPSAIFGRRVYEPYLANYLGEQAMTATLNRMVTPIFELKPPKRRQVAEMYEWANSVGQKERRNVTIDEIIQQFPEAGGDEYRGFYLLRRFNDTIYDIQNNRLYREWNNQGFKTITHAYGKAEYHGKPLTEIEAGSYKSGGALHAYDPEINGTRILGTNELEDLYKSGGQVLKADLTIKTGTDEFHKLFISDPKNINWRLESLGKQPLEYIPGYWTRMYEDFYFIEKVVDNAKVDGARGRHTYVTHVVGTQKEADALVNKLTEATEGGSATFRVRAPGKDPRLSEKDRIAMDTERMQVEGRLFFDDRNQERLVNAQGNPADIIDPINAIERTARMFSRQVATEDLVRGYKRSFEQQFGDLVPDMHSHTSGEIGQILNKAVKDSGGQKRLVAANNVWNYIRIMEGSVKRGPNAFKKLAIQAAEVVAEQLSGIPAARRPSEWMYRNAHRAAPVEALKTLAFIDYIVTRPLRQLVLQGGQHLFIQALDPTYAGKWQMETILMLQGMKRKVIGESGGKKLEQAMLLRNAKLMDIPVADYKLLLHEFDKSGLVQGINVHSLAGETATRLDYTPKDKLGDIVHKAADTATVRPLRDLARRKGFEAGEGFNVAASWLMALRMWRKEHGMKPISHMSVDDWEAIKTKGSDYGLAMVRPNAATFQYGILSLPMQFVQFTHKAFLTLLRAAPGPIGELGNKRFTKSQARKLVWGQAILFGVGAGFGLKPEIESAMESTGLSERIGAEATDIVVGGLVDFVIDKSLQTLTDDPELDLAFDEMLAPGANVINVARNIYEVAFETAIFDGFLGPSENTLSRFHEGYKLARFAVTQPDWTPVERATRALDAIAAGAASGYSDFFKARMAARHGKWLTAVGQDTDQQAKWAEIMAKGLLGLNPDYKMSQYESLTRADDWKKEIESAGKEWARVVNRAHRAWGDKTITASERDLMIHQQIALLAAFDEDPATFPALLEVFEREMLRLGKTRESYTDIIAEAMWSDGLPPIEHMKAQLDKVGFANPQERAELDKLIDKWTDLAKIEGDRRLEQLEELREESTDGR